MVIGISDLRGRQLTLSIHQGGNCFDLIVFSNRGMRVMRCHQSFRYLFMVVLKSKGLMQLN